MKSIFVIHYGELALKGGNRSWFENRLVRNIRRAMDDLDGVHVDRIYGRILLEPGADTDERLSIIEQRLLHVYGIAWFGRALVGELSWPVLCELTLAALPTEGNPTFGVRTKKADAEWARGRTETSSDLGAFIVEKKGWKVNLTNPDIWVQVEIASGRVLVAIEKIEGLKGLPVGVSGKAVTPWLLGRIVELTAGRSLICNQHLIINNATLAAALAVELVARRHSLSSGNAYSGIEQAVDP